MDKIETLVVGAGVVGLAIARQLALLGHQVVVAEAEKNFGSGVSSRNSGVIHAGIYYPAGSLKAKFCVAGREKLYEYARNRGIPHRQTGKLLVACNDAEIAKLASIKQRAEANGVSDLSDVDAHEAMRLEPELQCVAALVSPSTGIIDIHMLMESLIVDIEAHGGLIAYGNKIDRVEINGAGFRVFLEDGASFETSHFINAAGLGAQALAGRISGYDAALIPKQYLAKGNYFGVSGAAPFSRLVYPVPVDGGLGAHFTMNMAGESLFGPDVQWLGEGAAIDYAVDASRVDGFYISVSRYWPNVKQRELMPAYSGIRPKLAGKGMGDSDFTIHTSKDHGAKGLVQLFGIESPGLTASLAIAEYVAGQVA